MNHPIQKFLPIVSLGLLAILPISGHAAVLISWEVGGINAGSTPSFDGSPTAGIQSGSLTLGSGLSASSASDTFGGSNFDQVSLTDALAAGDYISFTITPGTGQSVSISDISYNLGLATATDFNAVLLSSRTGFTTSDALDTYSFGTASPATRTIAISSPALQGITTPTEFRVYGFRDASGTSTLRIRNLSGDDLIIAGTVSAAPLPEPAAASLLAGVAVLTGAIATRRRRGAVARA